MLRLPVAPPPFREETLSSWLGRVACRYGLDRRRLAAELAPGLRFDDVAPDPMALRLWAKACGVDPGRLHRLSLAKRYPKRRCEDLLGGGDPLWGQGQAVCPICLSVDAIERGDSFVRARWSLVEACACPLHRCLLIDRCGSCHAALAVAFVIREGSARAICATCRQEVRREGQGAGNPLAPLLVALQRATRAAMVDEERRVRLAEATATLWAPLDEAGAARPVLALWLDQPSWHCPVEAAPAVSAAAPLQQLPLRWRALTLMALGDLFGADLAALERPPASTARLLARAAPPPAVPRGRARHLSPARLVAACRRGPRVVGEGPVEHGQVDEGWSPPGGSGCSVGQ